MICEGCKAGADNAQDYRDAAREDDERRVAAGEPPFAPAAARRWLVKRLKWALALHCKRKGAGRQCDCQCRIPELKA